MNKKPLSLSAREVVFLSIGLFIMGGALLHAGATLSYAEMVESGEKERYWARVIEREGPEGAYDLFVQTALEKEPYNRHGEAHIFGAALYAQLGAKALGYCETEFGAGCLHEAFKWVLTEHGLENLPQAGAECKTSPERSFQCDHAIGHGLFAFYGYERDSLLQALKICKEWFYDDPINGCTGGAFMEYNLYTSLGPEVSVRPIDETGWYSECPTLPDEFKQACYTWLPQWWRVYLLSQDVSEEEIFSRMGDMCEGVPDSSHRQGCFERVGQHAAYASLYEPGDIRAYCAKAARDPRDHLSCLSYAGFIITQSDKTLLEKALAVCDGLDTEAAEYCRTHAENKASWLSPIPFPDMRLLRDEYPELAS